jgi:hypothetical protein
MGSWIDHNAISPNALFPEDSYALCIKLNKLGLKEDQYIVVGEDHNWYIPLVSGQQVEIGENVRVDGTIIVAQV